MEFISRLGPLDGKPAAVFCTYKLASGKTLATMATALEGRGATVTGRFKTKGLAAAPEFSAWIAGLA